MMLEVEEGEPEKCSECGAFMEKVEAEYGSEIYEELRENKVPGSWHVHVCNNCENSNSIDRERWEGDASE